MLHALAIVWFTSTAFVAALVILDNLITYAPAIRRALTRSK